VRKGGVVLVISMMAVIAGCSSGGGNGGASPGHGSPEDAVDGFATSLLSSNPGVAWCSYLQPSFQQECTSANVSVSLTGSYSIKSQVIDGTNALVSITGSLCYHGADAQKGCASNSNASAGMPPGAGSFSTAYASALNNDSNTLSPVPCIQVNGDWYVNEGSGSTTPTTSETTPTTTATTSPPTTTATTTTPTTGTTTPTTTATTIPATTTTTAP
jgi:hypothetical protein